MPESGPMIFSLEYEYTAYAYYKEIDISRVEVFSEKAQEDPSIENQPGL